MIRQICAVRDRAADSYGQPFFVTAVGQAVRSFADEVNRSALDNALYQHPEDFDLYSLGTFDDSTGRIESIDPRMIAIGKEMKNVTDYDLSSRETARSEPSIVRAHGNGR